MSRMYGVIPPMVTPFDEVGHVDFDALVELVVFLRDRVDGLFTTGSYGSGALMSVDERKRVTSTCVNAADGRVPIVSMVGTTNTADSVELTRHAEEVGVAAVSAVGPYYFHHDGDSLVRFFDALVRATSLPVYVYNNPKFQGYAMDITTITRLAEAGVAGVKDATFDILAHADYQRRLAPSGFDVVLGTEAMWLPARSLGCEAFIPGLGNAFPELCRDLHRSGMDGDWDRCRELQFRVNRLRDSMYHAASTQQAVYAMLELRGVVASRPREPFQPATREQVDAIRADLDELGLLS